MAFSITDIIILLIIVISTIIGLAKGIMTKILGFLNFIISLVIAFYVASPISSLFIDTSFYNNMANAIGSNGASAILLVISGLIVFILVFIVLKIIKGIFIRLLNKGKILNVINKLLGGVLGFLTGVFIATVYLLIFYGLANVDNNIGAFFVNDLALQTNDFTFSKMMLNYVIELFGSI